MSESFLTEVVILAAGRGTRMGSSLPKALVPLVGKPLIAHVVQAVVDSGISATPIVVVSPDTHEPIRAALGSRVRYAKQLQALGTANAVAAAFPELHPDTTHVLVLYTDHPLVTARAIRELAQSHQASLAVLSMATTLLEDFVDWRSVFYHFGRIVRESEQNLLKRIIEFGEADETIRALTEVNPGYYCFDRGWLEQTIQLLKPHVRDNGNHEYYLTDLVHEVTRSEGEIGTVLVSPEEALGVNTPEELAIAEAVLFRSNQRIQ